MALLRDGETPLVHDAAGPDMRVVGYEEGEVPPFGGDVVREGRDFEAIGDEYGAVLGDLLIDAHGAGASMLRVFQGALAQMPDGALADLAHAARTMLTDRAAAKGKADRAARIDGAAWCVALAARLWPGSPGAWHGSAPVYAGTVWVSGPLAAYWSLYPASPRLRDGAPEVGLSVGYSAMGNRRELFTAVGLNGHLNGSGPAMLETAYRAALRSEAAGPARAYSRRVVRALVAMLPAEGEVG